MWAGGIWSRFLRRLWSDLTRSLLYSVQPKTSEEPTSAPEQGKSEPHTHTLTDDRDTSTWRQQGSLYGHNSGKKTFTTWPRCFFDFSRFTMLGTNRQLPVLGKMWSLKLDVIPRRWGGGRWGKVGECPGPPGSGRHKTPGRFSDPCRDYQNLERHDSAVVRSCHIQNSHSIVSKFQV